MEQSHPRSPTAHRPTVVQPVPIAHIDVQDDTFATCPPWFVNRPLLRSIERIGVSHPVLLQQHQTDRLRVVCGFQRLRLAGRAGITVLPARIVKEGDRHALLHMALFENLGTRAFSELEKAVAVRKLAALPDISEEQILADYFPALDLRPDLFHYKRCLALARLPRRIQRHLSALRVEIALKLVRWDAAEQKLFLDLIQSYAPSRSHQKRLFELLDDLRARGLQRGERTPLAEVWKATGCLQLHEQAPARDASTFRQILSRLHQNRYPELGEMTSTYERSLKSLSLPGGVRVAPPPFFEGDCLSFQFSAHSPEELAEFASRLEHAARRPELRKIFDLL